MKAGVALYKVNFEEDWVPEIRGICKGGEKIRAIKRCRELLPHLSLKDAKELVEKKFATELYNAGYKPASPVGPTI